MILLSLSGLRDSSTPGGPEGREKFTPARASTGRATQAVISRLSGSHVLLKVIAEQHALLAFLS